MEHTNLTTGYIEGYIYIMGYIELVGGGQDHVCPSADKRQTKITQETDPNSKRDLFLRTPHRIL